MGHGSRPDCRRNWYSTFAPFPDTCPRNQPALAQTYATVVVREGRVSGEQMLTVGRGLRTTATAAVHKALFELTHCQDSVRLQTVAAANNMSVVSTSLMSTHTKPGPSAGEPLVEYNTKKTFCMIFKPRSKTRCTGWTKKVGQRLMATILSHLSRLINFH